MRSPPRRWTNGTSGLLAAAGLVAADCGKGGHHGGRADAAASQTCSGRAYYGDQGGGGNRFAACVSGNEFSLTDEASGATTQGTYQSSAAFQNLFLLSSSSPSAGTATAAEMQSAALLVNPGTLPLGASSFNPLVLVSWETGFCPPSGSNYRYVTTPNDAWTPALTAYGTISLLGATATVTGVALDGTPTGSQTVPISCDLSTSEWNFMNLNGDSHKGVVSPSGLFVDKGGGGGSIGVPKATTSLSIVNGQTYLGLVVEANASVGTRTVGFRSSGTASLTGFDPTISGAPPNGINLVLGQQLEAGLFTGGSFSENGIAIPGFAAVGANVAGRFVLYGIAFGADKNTPVTVLLLQQ